MTDVAASPDGCVYRIDASDTITYVNPEWIRFAEANDAPDLTADAVVGKSIWAFIHGADTQSLYKELFRNLRSHPSEIMIPFRCDSPTIIRRRLFNTEPVPRLEETVCLECRTYLGARIR